MALTRNNSDEQQLRAIRQAEAAAERAPSLLDASRTGRRAASALTAACGLVVAASPLAVAYAGGLGQWNAVAAGAAVALLGLVRATGLHRLPLLSYASFGLGVWILVTSFWLEGSGGARAITGVFGFLIAGFALASAAHSDRDPIASSSG